MFGKLNHLAITSDHYTLLGMFYRAAFGLKSSGDTAREIGAISVGDGYLGMTLIPRRGGRKAGLDHFGIEVADLEKVRQKVAKKYPDIEIVKRPGNRPFASYSAHDPAGNYFDLSQPGHENRAEVYAKGEWKQDTTFSHFALRAREAERVANFYADVFELEARNLPSEEGGYHLTDGRVTMAILPWKISSFNGAGIEQPGMDHIGFRVPELDAFKAHLNKLAKTNICLAPKPIDFDSEGAASVAQEVLVGRIPAGRSRWHADRRRGSELTISGADPKVGHHHDYRRQRRPRDNWDDPLEEFDHAVRSRSQESRRHSHGGREGAQAGGPALQDLAQHQHR
jgi:predicted enzyme related to lactoylglutathione lyase